MGSLTFLIVQLSPNTTCPADHLTISIYKVLCPAPRFTTMPGTLSTEHIKCIENTRAIMKASCNMYQFDLYISLSIVYCSSIVSNFWEEDEISTGLLINWNHLREALYCKTINFHFIFPWECYHRLSVYLLKVECTVVWSSVGYKIASSPAFPQCHVAHYQSVLTKNDLFSKSTDRHCISHCYILPRDFLHRSWSFQLTSDLMFHSGTMRM